MSSKDKIDFTQVQATTHLAETTVLADFSSLTIFSAIYVVVVHCILESRYLPWDQSKNRMKFELSVNIGGIADVVFVRLASNISFCSHRVRFQLGKKSR